MGLWVSGVSHVDPLLTVRMLDNRWKPDFFLSRIEGLNPDLPAWKGGMAALPVAQSRGVRGGCVYGSQVIEMALVEFLRNRMGAKNEIVVSQGHFKGAFSREETYDR